MDRTSRYARCEPPKRSSTLSKTARKRKLPLDDVYRQLYNPAMYLRSYAKLYRNDGAMTPGTTGETVDGMSLEKIDRVIEAIRLERWVWPPARRVHIDKPKGGKRPLGMPDWSPKVVQDIIRLYWKPIMNHNSQTTVTDSDRKGDAKRPSPQYTIFGWGPNGSSKETSRVV